MWAGFGIWYCCFVMGETGLPTKGINHCDGGVDTFASGGAATAEEEESKRQQKKTKQTNNNIISA